MQKIQIYNSKVLNYKAAFSFILFTAIAGLNIYKFGFSWFWLVAMLICVVGWVVNFARYFTYKQKVLLEISETGIHDRYQKQFIKWGDIYNLTLTEGAVTVILNDPKTARPKYWWNRIKVWWNNLRYGSPIIISTDVLQGKEFDNYNILYDYMEAVENQENANAVNASL